VEVKGTRAVDVLLHLDHNKFSASTSGLDADDVAISHGGGANGGLFSGRTELPKKLVVVAEDQAERACYRTLLWLG
jgi:hypothetical protein